MRPLFLLPTLLLAACAPTPRPSAPATSGRISAIRHERLGIELGMARAHVQGREDAAPFLATSSTLTYHSGPGALEEVTYAFRDDRLSLVAYVGYPDALNAEIAYDLEKYALVEKYDEPPVVEEPFNEETYGTRALWLWPGLAVSLIVERTPESPSGHRLTLRYFVPEGE